MEGLRLNIKESSLRKKRGPSFFDGKDPNSFNELEQVAEHGNDYANMNDESNRTAGGQNAEKDPFKGYQSVKISQVVQDLKNQKSLQDCLGIGQTFGQPQTKIISPRILQNRQSALDSSVPSFMKQTKPVFPTASNEKEIVSALVRLNTQGFNVPLNIDEIKKLPIIPGTGTRTYAKHLMSRTGGRDNFLSINEKFNDEDFTDEDELTLEDGQSNLQRPSSLSYQNKTLTLGQTLEEDSTTVFDLVHRGRQRQQHYKQLQKQAANNKKLLAPSIITPTGVDYRGDRQVSRVLKQSAQLLTQDSNVSLEGAQSFLLGRKHLSQSRDRQQGRQHHTNPMEDQAQKKKAIKYLHQEIQSAVLPEISHAGDAKYKSRSVGARKNKKLLEIEKDQSLKKVEYVHEEFYDNTSKGKWTIFNKHALEVEESSQEDQLENSQIIEDRIIEKMRLEDDQQHAFNISLIPESIWNKLYESKCQDLGIPCVSDKQKERFISQMMFNQRNDRISFDNQGMSYFSAEHIGRDILSENDNLLYIDLSNNQLQKNMRPIVNGIKNNKRLISFTMRNNEIDGREHSEYIKEIVKNHPSLTVIDFSNSDLYVRKNKIRDKGAKAIVDGIIESNEQQCSLISEINLGYCHLTSQSLPYLAQLRNPEWIQLQNLNLSFNDLGNETVQILSPILPSIITLNLSSTKLTNQCLTDLASCFKKQEMKLQDLQIASNSITSEGLYFLLVCLKTNNKVKTLNISKNELDKDFKHFRMIQKFLSCNKILEYLNMGHCNIGTEGGKIIGKGLRGNRSLQTLVLKDNELKESISDIAKAFVGNQIALCLKELDISKCQISCDHITGDFLKMLKSKYTTLKTLNMRDNLIGYQSSEQIKDALKINKSITKINLEYNPIKQQVLEAIEKLCNRNIKLDELNLKHKNIHQLAKLKQKAQTQKQLLNTKIEELKKETDESIAQAHAALSQIEKLQKCRKTSENYFSSVSHALHYPAPCSSTGNNSKTASKIDIQDQTTVGGGGYCPIQEPKTSLTKQTAATNVTLATSQIQHSRHKSQGPMRSEKVYLMTQIIKEKVEQLNFERGFVEQKFIQLDEENDQVKKSILKQTQSYIDKKEMEEQKYKDKEEELIQIDLMEKELIANQEKQMQDLKDHIQAVKLGQEKASSGLKSVRGELKVERKKYDAFLQRDAEKLVWAHDLIRCRRLVQVSYENELKRVQERLEEQKNKEAVEREAMEEARLEFERLEALKYKKKGTQKMQRQKTQVIRPKETQTGPYSNIKSRLFKSIESSRQKQVSKYPLSELEKKALLKEKQKSNKENQPLDQGSATDIHQVFSQKSGTQKDHYTPLDTPNKNYRQKSTTDAKPAQSGLKKSTAKNRPLSIVDSSKNATNISNNKSKKESMVKRKTVVFKQQSQTSMGMPSNSDYVLMDNAYSQKDLQLPFQSSQQLQQMESNEQLNHPAYNHGMGLGISTQKTKQLALTGGSETFNIINQATNMICNIDTSTTEVQPLPAPILKKSRTDLFNRSKE